MKKTFRGSTGLLIIWPKINCTQNKDQSDMNDSFNQRPHRSFYCISYITSLCRQATVTGALFWIMKETKQFFLSLALHFILKGHSNPLITVKRIPFLSLPSSPSHICILMRLNYCRRRNICLKLQRTSTWWSSLCNNAERGDALWSCSLSVYNGFIHPFFFFFSLLGKFCCLIHFPWLIFLLK